MALVALLLSARAYDMRQFSIKTESLKFSVA